MSWDAQPPSEPPQPAGAAGYDQYGQPIVPQQPMPEQVTQPFPQQHEAPQWHAPRPDPAQWNATQQWDAAQTSATAGNPYPQNPDAWAQTQYQTQYQSAPPFFAAPPKRSRTGMYVGLGAGAVLVAGVVAAVVAMSGGNPGQSPGALGGPSATATAVAGSSTPNQAADTGPTGSGSPASQTARTLRVPQAAGPLRLVTNGDIEQRISDLKKNLASNAAYPNPLVGFYRVGSSGSFSVWLLAQSTTNIADFQTSLGIMGPSGLMKQITGGAPMKNVTVENPGPLGGALDCGKLNVDGTDVRACVWVDNSTFGWVYFLPSVSQGKLVQYTLDLRSAAER
jgi:hypothetical protein